MAKKKRILGCNIDSDVIDLKVVQDFAKEHCNDIKIVDVPKFNVKKGYDDKDLNILIKDLNDIINREDLSLAPSIIEIMVAGYHDFAKRIYKSNFKYSEVLSNIKIKTRRVYRKPILEQLSKELKNIASYINDIIGIPFDHSPNPNQLTKLGYRGFIIFLQKNHIDFKQVADHAGLHYRNWHSEPLSYIEFIDLALKMGVIFLCDENRFNNVMKTRQESPSHVLFDWFCFEHGIWWTSFQTLKNSVFGCPSCYKKTVSISFSDVLDLARSKGVLSLIISEDNFNSLILEEKKKAKNSLKPSQIPLPWRCIEHGDWKTPFAILRNSKKGCPSCGLEEWSSQIRLKYYDFVDLADSRSDLAFMLSPKQFEMMMSKTSLPPSQLYIPWKCLYNSAHGHWMAPYSRIKRNHGCPFCVERVRGIGILIHRILEYYSELLLRNRQCSVEVEVISDDSKGIKPDLIIQNDSVFIDSTLSFQGVLSIPKKVKRVMIDFTLSKMTDTIIKKSLKGYQGDSDFLIIVLLKEPNKNVRNIEKIIKGNEYIDNSHHIRIINFNDYLNFCGFKDGIEFSLQSKMTQSVDLAIQAIESDKFLEQLPLVEKIGDKLGHYKNKLKVEL